MLLSDNTRPHSARNQAGKKLLSQAGLFFSMYISIFFRLATDVHTAIIMYMMINFSENEIEMKYDNKKCLAHLKVYSLLTHIELALEICSI